MRSWLLLFGEAVEHVSVIIERRLEFVNPCLQFLFCHTVSGHGASTSYTRMYTAWTVCHPILTNYRTECDHDPLCSAWLYGSCCIALHTSLPPPESSPSCGQVLVLSQTSSQEDWRGGSHRHTYERILHSLHTYLRTSQSAYLYACPYVFWYTHCVLLCWVLAWVNITSLTLFIKKDPLEGGLGVYEKNHIKFVTWTLL